MKFTARAWIPVSAVALALSVAQGSGASPSLYTLDSSVDFGPIPFSSPSTEGTVDPYLFSDGALDTQNHAICLDGVCADNQDWIVFRVTVDPGGALDQVTLAALTDSANGMGYFDNLGGTAPSSYNFVATAPEFFFAPQLTGMSALLFATYDAGALPTTGLYPNPETGPLDFGAGAFQFDLRVGGASEAYIGNANTLVPEPSTGLLLGLGIVGFGVARRRAPPADAKK